MTTVHLGYAVDDFHGLFPANCFCRKAGRKIARVVDAAGIPDELAYRPKWQIALELYDRARANGVTFRYLTFDEGYGGKPEFLRQLEAREQVYVAEVPRTFTGWLNAPYVTDRPYRRLAADAGVPYRGWAPAARRPVVLSIMLHHWMPALKDQAWERWRIKDTQKGPMVWETKHVQVCAQGRERPACRAAAPDRGPQRARRSGGEILRQQRAARNAA